MDTEFLRETTYHPRFCLLQLADAHQAVCIDPLTIDDLSPLKDLLFNPAITKICHAGRQDLEIFYYLWQELPKPLFDTQPAAALLGLGDQIGYAALVEALLDIRLDKGMTRTDWSQRPLEPEQLDYAYQDVIHLGELYLQMRKRLSQQDRLAWLDQDFEALTSVETYQIQPEESWKKVKGLQQLRGVQYALLQTLAAWREKEALSQNRPRRRILSDDILIQLCRRRPKNLQQLNNIQGLRDKEIGRWGEIWLILMEKAGHLPKSNWPALQRPPRLTPEQEIQLDLLSAALRQIALDAGMTASAIANRRDLENLIQGESNSPLTQGWRRALAGERLMGVIRGEIELKTQKGALNFGLPC